MRRLLLGEVDRVGGLGSATRFNMKRKCGTVFPQDSNHSYSLGIKRINYFSLRLDSVCSNWKILNSGINEMMLPSPRIYVESYV